jgi:hypothetical protein
MNDTSFKCVFFYYVTLVHLGLPHKVRDLGKKKNDKIYSKENKTHSGDKLISQKSKKEVYSEKKDLPSRVNHIKS